MARQRNKQYGYYSAGLVKGVLHSSYPGAPKATRIPKPKKEKAPRKVKALPERGVVSAVCQRCGRSFKTLERAYGKELSRFCGRCLSAVLATKWRHDERKTAAKRRPMLWRVTCLRCSWSAEVKGRLSKWACPNDPSHPTSCEKL